MGFQTNVSGDFQDQTLKKKKKRSQGCNSRQFSRNSSVQNIKYSDVKER